MRYSGILSDRFVAGSVEKKKIWVVRSYVPRTPGPPKLCTSYSRNQIPCTLETMNLVQQPRKHVLSTLDTTYFHQKSD